jgi:hypothetical protein
VLWKQRLLVDVAVDVMADEQNIGINYIHGVLPRLTAA